MKFTASNALSPSLSLVINKGIRVILGGTEEPFGVQGEDSKTNNILSIYTSEYEIEELEKIIIHHINKNNF